MVFMKKNRNAGVKYTKRSFLAFLEGQSGCNEKWLLGIIRASAPDDIKEALKDLSLNADPDRVAFLRRSCEMA